MTKKEASSKLSTPFHPPPYPTSTVYSTFWFVQGHCSLFLVSQLSSYLLFWDLKLASGCFSAHLHVWSRYFSSHLQGSPVLDARAGDSVVVCVSLIVLFMCLFLCRFVMDYLFVRLLPFLSSVRGVCFAEVVSSNAKKYKKKSVSEYSLLSLCGTNLYLQYRCHLSVIKRKYWKE